jgi:hypothetical protein
MIRKLGPDYFSAPPVLNGATYPPKLILPLPGLRLRNRVTLGRKLLLRFIIRLHARRLGFHPIEGDFMTRQNIPAKLSFTD